MKEQYFKQTQFIRKYIFMIFLYDVLCKKYYKIKCFTRLYFNDTTK